MLPLDPHGILQAFVAARDEAVNRGKKRRAPGRFAGRGAPWLSCCLFFELYAFFLCNSPAQKPGSDSG